ncbi:DEKNAAC100941 [Brettanomyces naardenensis]|uniref:DEKNAAC100941 n=1 Tax=Brettanomyces naardenensis TaxID=13370 RepID=A0A448YGX8_BRENA|nr:DEKNAAC100941 [Brettanomyces naardenensis]
MSLTANELNYLIWRYLQEGGLDVSAYALQEETEVNEYEPRLGAQVPLGCLVDLVQKGILYTKVNKLVSSDKKVVSDDVMNLDFNLFGAIAEEGGADSRRLVKPEREEQDGKQGKREMKKEEGQKEKQQQQQQPEANNSKEDTAFTKILTKYYNFPQSLTNSFNPLRSNVLVWGQRDQYSVICTLHEKEDPQLKVLPHPITSKDTIAVSWSPSGDSIVTASENGELRMWDLSGSIRFIMALHHSPVIAVQWSPNGSHLLTLDVTNKTIIWDTTSGQPVQHAEVKAAGTDDQTAANNTCFGTEACWIDDYKFVVPGADYTLQVFQLGDVDQELPIGILSGHLDSISSVSYNSSLKLLCSASDDRTIRIWKGNSTNSLQILLGHSEPITYLHWLKARDNKWYLVSCSLDSSLRIWDFINGEVIDLNIVDSGVPILTAAISHDYNKLATGDSEGTVLVWELTDDLKYKQVSCFQAEGAEKDQNSLISSISWSKDDSMIAVSCSNSKGSIVRI